MNPDRYHGPEWEAMLGWGDLYALYDDLCPAMLPDGRRHHLAEFIVAVLDNSYDRAARAIARYNEEYGIKETPSTTPG